MLLRFATRLAGLITALTVTGLTAGMDSPASDKDVRAGERIYIQCTGCHAPDYNRTGPKHCGISGRAAGGVDDFEYTKAMVNSGIIWSRETLDQFLLAPFKLIPGTSMGFAGIASAQERQQLIAYLSQLDEKNAICQ